MAYEGLEARIRNIIPNTRVVRNGVGNVSIGYSYYSFAELKRIDNEGKLRNFLKERYKQ